MKKIIVINWLIAILFVGSACEESSIEGAMLIFAWFAISSILMLVRQEREERKKINQYEKQIKQS
jgi:hypothetical protein